MAGIGGALAFLLLAAAGTARAGDGSLARVVKSGRLVAACDLTYPPMAFESNGGQPDGFSVDVAKDVGARLKVKTEYMVMNWDGILAGLASRRYDAIICTMNITKERERSAAFVEFVRLAQVFVARKGLMVKTAADLAGRVVAVQADTTSETFVHGQEAKGVAIRGLKGFKLATDAFAALKAGQADVIVVDEPVGRYYVKQDPGAFAITGQAMTPEPVGIAVNKQDVELQQAIAGAIAAMRGDGTMKRLSMTWFGGELGAGL